MDLDRGRLHRASADAVLSNKRQPPCPMPRQLVVLARIWKSADNRIAALADGPRLRKVDRFGCPENHHRPRELGANVADEGRGGLAIPPDRSTNKSPVIHFNGRPIASVKRAFREACADAGLEGVTPHTLRHTAITWAMQAGVPIHEAAGYFGVSRETMERVYIHHHPDHMKAVREAMERKR